jgi:hypothetical protein
MQGSYSVDNEWESPLRHSPSQTAFFVVTGTIKIAATVRLCLQEMAVKNTFRVLYSSLPILPVPFYPLCSLPNMERRQAATSSMACLPWSTTAPLRKKPIPIRLDWECHPA